METGLDMQQEALSEIGYRRANVSCEQDIPLHSRLVSPVPVTYVLGVFPLWLWWAGPSHPHSPGTTMWLRARLPGTRHAEGSRVTMFFISGLYGDQVPSFASFTQETPASAHEQTVPSFRDYMHLNKGLSGGGLQEGEVCCWPISSLEWKGKEREINNSLFSAGYWSAFPAQSTSYKGNCLTLRQGSVRGEQDKIKLQVTA